MQRDWLALTEWVLRVCLVAGFLVLLAISFT
ncbi:hypothetical protein QO006_002874 [Deinococcus enclensis]|uniref:Uncharacterized protein n=1 Tax=Deinococcus enclensis TaxID=1049582 RepID=A0ABT9MFP2_9DEIO|nr:hypothetical protein [Deinococcus enclensis]